MSDDKIDDYETEEKPEGVNPPPPSEIPTNADSKKDDKKPKADEKSPRDPTKRTLPAATDQDLREHLSERVKHWMDRPESVDSIVRLYLTESKEFRFFQPVWRDGLDIWVGDFQVPFANKFNQLKLVEIFLANPKRSFSRSELETLMYGPPPEDMTDRMRDSRHQRINKLIERARNHLSDCTNVEVHWIDWLYFDRKYQKFRFYRKRADYPGPRPTIH